jgi:hypothetical protein
VLKVGIAEPEELAFPTTWFCIHISTVTEAVRKQTRKNRRADVVLSVAVHREPKQ